MPISDHKFIFPIVNDEKTEARKNTCCDAWYSAISQTRENDQMNCCWPKVFSMLAVQSKKNIFSVLSFKFWFTSFLWIKGKNKDQERNFINVRCLAITNNLFIPILQHRLIFSTEDLKPQNQHWALGKVDKNKQGLTGYSPTWCCQTNYIRLWAKLLYLAIIINITTQLLQCVLLICTLLFAITGN